MLLAIDIFAATVLSIIILRLLRMARLRAAGLRLYPSSQPSPLLQKKPATARPSLPQFDRFSPEPRFLQWQQSDFDWAAQPREDEDVAADTTFPEETPPANPAEPPVPADTASAQTHDGLLKIEEKNYADPIDGMLFEAGEPVVSCRCGLGYRAESILWLHRFAGGRCAQCGAEIALPVDLL